MADADVFWDNVQSVIKFLDLKQEWVAEKAGIRFGTFHGWISKGIYPRAGDAVRIAAVLNTSVESLVSGGSAGGASTQRKKQKDALLYHISTIREHLQALEKEAHIIG